MITPSGWGLLLSSLASSVRRLPVWGLTHGLAALVGMWLLHQWHEAKSDAQHVRALEQIRLAEQAGLRRSTAATRLSCVVCGLLLASTLAACATATPPAPVTPSVLQEAPPAGDFRMRLEHFFDPKPTAPTN